MIVKFIILAALIRLLIATDKPLLCSGLYALVGLVFSLLAVASGEASILSVLIATVIGFALSSLYFWLLNRIGEGPVWWVVLIAGLTIGLV